MGRLKSNQGRLFYEFRPGDAFPEDHLVRKISTRAKPWPHHSIYFWFARADEVIE
jgi:hypothetical protein